MALTLQNYFFTPAGADRQGHPMKTLELSSVLKDKTTATKRNQCRRLLLIRHNVL